MVFPVRYNLQRPRAKLGKLLGRVVGWEHAQIVIAFNDGSQREYRGDVALVLAERLQPWLESLEAHVASHPFPVDFDSLTLDAQEELVRKSMEDGGSFLDF